MKTTEKKRSFEEIIETGNVSFFGYRHRATPEFVSNKKQGRVKFFHLHKNLPKNPSLKDSTYEQLTEIREEKSDIYFLDHEATKVLLSDFPASSRYVAVRIIPRLEWILAVPGLMRRLFIGLIKIKGVKNITSGNKKESWLILEHMLTEVLHTRLSLSEDVGIAGFLKYLKENSTRYVVLRFFEKLPELYREGGDIDLLVSDEDEKLIKNFLVTHPGSVNIDVWTVSRTTFNDVTYYPPALAKEIIDNAMEGPAGSRIPSPRHAFLAFAYHVLYHKGPFAGVPSSLSGVVVNKEPENDYLGTLERMAKDLRIDIPITMESLDEYLYQEGWRPQLDTLAKIAPKNKWVWERFFSQQGDDEVGLGIFILKQKALKDDLMGNVIQTITKFGSFKILCTKIFNDNEVNVVTKKLRGGVWRIPEAQNPDDYLPAAAILVLDKNLARLREFKLRQSSVSKKGIRELKKELRRKFAQNEKGNIVHATDNTHETWEYIPFCFPNEVESIQEVVDSELNALSPSFITKLKDTIIFAPRIISYQMAKHKRRFKNIVLSMLMRV